MRLDVYIFNKGLSQSRTEAKLYISEGAVTVDGKVINKPSYEVSENSCVIVDKSIKKYVSRGGLKLEGAIEKFNISVKGRFCIDIGASTGGFTDCLLQNGARKVIALDSGSGQLAESIRLDERVTVIENYNARYLSSEDMPFIPDLAVMDVSFISATYIIGAIFNILSDSGDFLCLIKPQFEVGPSNIGKGGIVKSEKARKEAIDKVVDFAKNLGFKHLSTITSPITGGDGNIEYLSHFKK